MEPFIQALTEFEHSWRTRRLQNGVIVTHVPLSGADERFELAAVFGTGSTSESTHNSGVSHFLEHMMFRGSRSYPSFHALTDAFEWLGGEWNGATGHEHTEYSFGGVSRTAAETIRLFADFLHHPNLLEMDRERQVILREIDDFTNEFGHSIDLDQHVKALVWPESSFALPILGTKESVEGLSLPDLQVYRSRFYGPQNLTISLVGGGAQSGLLDRVEEAFSTYAVGASIPHQAAHLQSLHNGFVGPRFKWVEHTDNQYQVSVAFPCEGEWSSKAPAYQLLSSILADGLLARLPLRLREELGLVYDVTAAANLHSAGGTFEIGAAVILSQLEHLVKEVGAVLTDLAQNGPTEKEVEKAKRRATVDLQLFASSPGELSFWIAWHQLARQDISVVRAINDITALTATDLRRVAADLFSVQNLALVVLGPKKAHLEEKMMDVITKHFPS